MVPNYPRCPHCGAQFGWHYPPCYGQQYFQGGGQRVVDGVGQEEMKQRRASP